VTNSWHSFFSREEAFALKEGQRLSRRVDAELAILEKRRQGIFFYLGDPDEAWSENFEPVEATEFDDSVTNIVLSDYDVEDLFFCYLREKGLRKFVKPHFENWKRKYFQSNFLKKEALQNEAMRKALKVKGIVVEVVK